MLEYFSAIRSLIPSRNKTSLFNNVGFKDVSFSYGDLQIFDQASWSGSSNSVIALFGINGCGKTTALRLICGSLSLNDFNGNIFPSPNIATFSFSSSNSADLNPFLKCKDVINMILESHNHSVDIPAEKLSLMIGFGKYYNTRIRQLSSGKRKILSIFRALSSLADIILLDEPFTHLDDQSTFTVIESINAIKDISTIIIASHRRDILHTLTNNIFIVSGNPSSGGDGKIFPLNH